MTHSRAAVRGLLAAHDITPSRALGQNFVADAGTVRRIARLARVGAGDRVLEIGAGLGSLTLALAETGASITAIETDRHLLSALSGVLAETSVQLIAADATSLDWPEVLGTADGWVLVANLPYNIATPLVLDVLDDVPQVARLLVLVQREVAERLVAQPGSRTFGIPSVKVAYHATGSIVGSVGPSVFVPKPRVDSALVELVRRLAPAVSSDPAVLFDLVRSAFGQRRKMLRGSLGGLVSAEQFARAGVDPTARPETLGVQAWGALADAVQAP